MERSFDDYFEKGKAPAPAAPDRQEPPEPPPTPEPKAEPEPKGGKRVVADLDKAFDKISKPPEPPKPAAPPETPAPEKPAQPQQHQPAKELRAAYENVKSELSKRDESINQLKKELEGIRSAKPVVPPEEAKAWQTEKDKLAARIKALEGEIVAVDFTRSTEFQEEFQAPLNDAYKTALQRIKSLKVTDENGDARAASPDDFDRVLSLPLDQAVEYAERFGKAAPIIMSWRERIEELANRKHAEVARRKEKAPEYISEQQKAQQEMMQQFRQSYDTRWQAQVEKLPQLYGPDEKDDEGNKYLNEDRQLVDFAFEATDAEPMDIAMARAEIGLRAMAFRRAMHRLNLANQEISSLKEKLTGYEKSQPGSGQPAQQAGEKKYKSIIDGIDDIPSLGRY
jgi:hypothetical protein